MSRLSFRLWLSAVFVASLVLRWLVPPNPAYGAMHDDQLMVRLASQIRAGNWLGDYADQGHLTLSKPAGYPLFLAHSHFMPWAPTVTCHLLLLAGVGLIVRELRRADMSRRVVLGFATLTVFLPSFYGNQMSRIYRESLLVGLTAIAIGLAMRLGYLLSARIGLRDRGRRGLTDLVVTSGALGVTFSMYIATKPSWYPLAFTCGVLAMWSFVTREWPAITVRLATVALAAGVLAVGLSSVVGYVVLQNRSHYGIARLDSFTSGPYAEALKTWTSVRSDDPRPYVLIDASQRAKVYAVSPTAAKLEPYLELPPGVGWRSQPCKSALKICDESATWFPWDLRDAVQAAGLGDTAEEFDRTFARIAADIREGCSSRELVCGWPGLVPGVLSARDLPYRVALDATVEGVGYLLRPPIADVVRGPYTDVSPEIVRLWKGVVKGLPDTDYVAVYSPGAVYFSSVVSVLDEIHGVLWIPAVLLATGGLLLRIPGQSRRDHSRLVAIATMGGALLAVAQMALLEASAGMYIRGSSLYLLPAQPMMVLAVAVGIERLLRYRAAACSADTPREHGRID